MNTVNILLRLPPDVKSWLVQRAHDNRRSINSELVVCLEALRVGDRIEGKGQRDAA